MIYLEELKAGGGTNLHDAIIAGLRNAHLPGVTATPVLILMTDGYPTVGVRDTETIKNNIKNENQKECGLYTIGEFMTMCKTAHSVFVRSPNLDSIAASLFENDCPR